MQNKLVSQLITFVIYLLFHIFVSSKVILWGSIYFYLYVNFLLLLSPQITKTRLLLVAFGVGTIIDMIEYSPGVHTAASLMLAFVRPYALGLLADTNKLNEDELRRISIEEIGFINYIIYAFSLIFIHHFFVFFLEAWTSSFIITTLKKTFFSSITTLFLSIIIQYLFLVKVKK
ncbi:MAG: hypothetical protein SFU27_06120 [Thermonemataceae bacterium]|nr:hypothetical protein [Thermonemataceae bacterium]